MIGQVIQATKDDQNAKKAPWSSKNEMLIFGLHSNSDDWPSNPTNESQLKCDKRPLSSKNEILIFILHSTSDDRLSNQMPPPCRKNLIFLKVHF